MSPRRKVERNYDLFSVCAWYMPGVAGLFALLGWFLLGLVLGGVVMIILRLVLPGLPLCYSNLIVYPVQFLPVLMFVRLKGLQNSYFDEGRALDNRHFGQSGGAVLAVILAFATIALSVILEPLTALLPELDESIMETLEEMLDGPLWVNLLCMAVLAPVFEEWLCRGVLLRGLLYCDRGKDKPRGLAPALAITISAVFFGAIHGNLTQGLSAFVMGCLFGYVYYKTGSLKLTMLMHCVNNSFAVILPKIFEGNEYFEISESLSSLMPTGWYIAVYIVSLCVLVFAVMTLRKIPLGNPQGNIDPVPAIAER